MAYVPGSREAARFFLKHVGIPTGLPAPPASVWKLSIVARSAAAPAGEKLTLQALAAAGAYPVGTALGRRRRALEPAQQERLVERRLPALGIEREAPGRLKAVKGMGWFVDDYNLAQVTVNLTDYRVTPPHVFFEAVKEEAAKLKVAVTGSEVVGLLPLEAMLMAADDYIAKEELLIYEEDQKIRLVVDRLGLNAVAPFDPAEKIIEYRVAETPEEPLAGSKLRDFIEQIGARTAAPGGGSASAAMAAIGAALGAMVAKLTYGVRKFEAVDRHMRQVIPVLHDAVQRLIPMIDADTAAFSDYMDGVRMPQETASEKAARHAKMQAGLKTAVAVPLQTMQLGDSVWAPLCAVARHGNPASRSDVEVGAKALEAGIWGAYRNVLINLEDIEDAAFKQSMTEAAEQLVQRAAEKCAEVLDLLAKA